MDRTNFSILLATALLGVLLYIVRQIGNTGLDYVTPPPLEPDRQAAAADSTRVVAAPQTTESALPIVDGAPALAALLDSLGLDGDLVVEEARQWYQQRGFIAGNPLLGADPDSELRSYYASLDGATLESLSAGGEVGATHELAARARLTNPFLAQQLLGKAVEQGSVNAWIQMASILETLADVNPNDFSSDPEFVRNLMRIGGRDAEDQLRYLAFVNAVTALRDGGEPVIDDSLLGWVAELGRGIPVGKLRQGCNQSFAVLIDMSKTRRAAGLPPLNTTPPPVFLGRTAGSAALPCVDTVNPIVSNHDLGNCAATEVLDRRGAVRVLYVCTTD